MNTHADSHSFLHHFLVIGSGSLIYLLVGLIGTPIITRLVSPADYGTVSMLNVYSQIGMILCGLGLDQTLVHHFHCVPDLDSRKRLLHVCCGFPLLLAVALGLCLLAAALWTRLSSLISWLILLEANVLALLLHRFAILTLRLRYRSKAYAFAQITQKSAYILISLGLILTIPGNPWVLLAISTILSTLFATAAAMLSESSMWRPPLTKAPLPLTPSALLRYGFPLMLSSGIHMLFQMMDRLFISHFCTMSDAGVYTGAVNLLAVFTILRTSFTALWTTTAMDHHRQHPEDHLFFRQGNGCISVLMLMAGACVVLCKDLIGLLLGPDYRDATMLLPILMFEPIFYTVSETTATGIAIAKKPIYSLLAAVGACLTNLIGNWWLTPLLGPQGAALSTAGAYLVFYALRTVFSIHAFPIKYPVLPFLISCAALAGFAGYGCLYTFDSRYFLLFLGVIIVIAVCHRADMGFMLAYALKLIKKKQGV